MNTREHKVLMPRELIYEMLTKENNYAAGWGEDGAPRDHEGVFPDHFVAEETGHPFSMMDFITFAEKYIDEAKLAYANYTPDGGAIRIRMLKAASLLVSGLQVYGEPLDLVRIAGVSSSKFHILHGGLQTKRDFEG